MAIKELILRTGRWFSAKRDGLYEPLQKQQSIDSPGSHSTVIIRRNEQKTDRIEALQMIQGSFEQLVEKLGGINEHLGKQVEQNAELLKRIDEIPQLLQNFPESMKNQKMVVDALVEQLKAQALKNQQFTEAVGKIPAAADAQTGAIKEMAGQIAASAAVDSQIVEGMRKFNNVTDKLKDNIEEQADSIAQMSRTFTASDRYLKYIVTTQHKRFMWVFIAALGVSTFAIIALLVVIFLLK